MNEVKREERGWAGHFICSDRCLFRRNTLLSYMGKKIVVSTVGNFFMDKGSSEPTTIGCNRYYETMAFESDYSDTRYYDADVSKQIYFESDWAIDHPDADDKANDMHETVLDEISDKLIRGDYDETTYH